MKYKWIRSREEQDRRDFCAKLYRRDRREGRGWWARYVWKTAKQLEGDAYKTYMGFWNPIP